MFQIRRVLWSHVKPLTSVRRQEAVKDEAHRLQRRRACDRQEINNGPQECEASVLLCAEFVL